MKKEQTENRRIWAALILLMAVVSVTGLLFDFSAEAVYAEGDDGDFVNVSTWGEVQKLVGTANGDTVKIRVTKDISGISGNARNRGNTVEIDLDGHTIDANRKQAFWNEKGSMTIRDGTIKNGRNDYGTVNNRGTMVLENVNITDCIANIVGGGIVNYGHLTMNGGKIAGCQAGRAGGLRIAPHDSDKSEIAQTATAILTNVEISGNKVDGRNDTYGRGAGISVTNGTLQMIHCVVKGNVSSNDDGGGIDFDAAGKTMTLKDTTVSGNKVSKDERQGGGINMERGKAVLEDCTITGNSAPDGGGMYIMKEAQVTISGTSSISNNTATQYGGGGITDYGALTLKDNVTITGNTSKGNGGAIYYRGGSKDRQLKIEGRIVAKDNRGGNAINNIFLYQDQTIAVTGKIDDQSSIGVKMTQGYHVITNSFKSSGNSDAKVFVHDGGSTTVLNNSGEACLEVSGDPSKSGDFHRVTVIIHPADHHYALNVRSNGKQAGQNAVQLYNIGDSQRLWLTSADQDSYYIDFFDGADDYSPSNKRFDIEDDDDYKKVGSIVHVVKGNEDAMNKRWKFIRNEDGTYYVQNKKSGLYWALNDSGYENGRKLCQKKLADAEKWEIEIVASDGDLPIEELKKYDSYTYTTEGRYITSCNWMSHLPDEMLLSDVSIPGTHDAATAHVTTSVNSSGQCQSLSIKDQLNNGIRYLDLRLGGGDELKLVHGNKGVYCKYNGDQLYLNKVMDWVFTFLDRNPTETVILQPKEDLGGDKTREALYKFYKKIATEHPERIYIGDHVPKMKDCRGKIVIISRIKNYDNDDYKVPGGQWAIDCTAWKASSGNVGNPLALTASGDDYEVWTQDDYESWDTWNTKWVTTKMSVFDRVYGAEPKRYSVRKDKSKAAWVVSYSSGVHWWDPDLYPQQVARRINPGLKDQLKDTNPGNGLFLGVVCSDFSDEQLAYLVYRQNFIRQHVIVKGVTVKGEEPIEPFVLDIGFGSIDAPPGTSLNHVDRNLEALKKYFSSKKGYRVRGDFSIRGMFRRKPISSYQDEEEYNKDRLNPTAMPMHGDYTLYVALDTALKGAGLELRLPGCEEDVSGGSDSSWAGQKTKPVFAVTSDPGFSHIRSIDGTQQAWWSWQKDGSSTYAGNLNTEGMTANVETEADFGYYYQGANVSAAYRSSNSKKSVPKSDVHTVMEESDPYHLKVSLPVRYVSHDLELVDPKLPTCTEDGCWLHYQCKVCKQFFRSTEIGRMPVEESTLIIPAVGHIPDEAEVENRVEATCKAEGSYDMVSRCAICETVLSSEHRTLAKTGHSWDEGSVTKEATCTEPGSETYECQICHTRMTEEIPALDHKWGEWKTTKESTETKEGEQTRTCENDPSHTQTRILPIKNHEHRLTKVDAKEAGCTEDGHTEYWICDQGDSPCQRYFADENASQELDWSEIVIPAGHDWDEGVVSEPVGCTTDGVMTYTCRRNPEHTKTEAIKASGHKGGYDNRTVKITTADCTHAEYSYKVHYCKGCGEVLYSHFYKSGDSLGHDWGDPVYKWSDDDSLVTATRICRRNPEDPHIAYEEVKVKSETKTPASCESAGTELLTASFENDAFTTQTKEREIPALGHDWDEGSVTTKPTCTEHGVRTFTCKHDSAHTRTEAIPATGHDLITSVEDDTATCTEGGTCVVKTYCSKCGEVEKTEQKESRALGHSWGEPEYKWNLKGDSPSITGTVICEVCGEKFTETVAATYEDTDQIRTWYGGPFKSDCFETQELEEALPDKPSDGDGKENKPSKQESASAKVSGTLLAKMTAKGKKALTISWTKVKGADGYDVFLARCSHKGKKHSYKRVKTVKAGKKRVYKKSGLKKKTAYKVYVRAYVMKNGKKKYVKKSPTIHAYTSGSTRHYTNSKSVTVKKTRVTLKKGKSYKIKASVKKLKMIKKLIAHTPKLRYLSTDKTVAIVSKSGKIIARGKGKCIVYVYAANGARKAVTVTVP